MTKILFYCCLITCHFFLSTAIAADKVVVIPLNSSKTANQSCLPGKYVTGFDARGDIICKYPLKYIFVSSTPFSGRFGGFEGADTYCQTMANSVPLGGVFKAWVSTSSSSPSAYFIRHRGDYITPTGIVVANGWDDLTDGTLQHPINITESGGLYEGLVWTDTAVNGGQGTLDNCSNWTTSDPSTYATVGSSSVTSGWWTRYFTTSSCDHNYSIYCVQQ